MLLAASEGSNWGWGSAATVGAGGAAVVVLVVWAVVEVRRGDPLINLRVVRNRDVLLANGTAISLGTAMYMSLSTLYVLEDRSLGQAPRDRVVEPMLAQSTC